jgi:hypothetical protein
MLLMPIFELIKENFADLEIALHDALDASHQCDGQVVKVGKEPVFSTTYWAIIGVTGDRIHISFQRYNRVSYLAHDNRTEHLELDLLDPESLTLLVRSLRRYFCKCWGNHLKPSECSPGGVDT